MVTSQAFATPDGGTLSLSGFPPLGEPTFGGLVQLGKLGRASGIEVLPGRALKVYEEMELPSHVKVTAVEEFSLRVAG